MDSKAHLTIIKAISVNQGTITRSYQGDTDVTGETMVGRLLQTGMF